MLPVLLHRLGCEKPFLPLLGVNGGYCFCALLLAATVLRSMAAA